MVIKSVHFFSAEVIKNIGTAPPILVQLATIKGVGMGGGAPGGSSPLIIL